MYKFQYNNNIYNVKQYIIYNIIHLPVDYKMNLFAKT